MIKEIWKEVLNFEGNYKVSNYGRVINIKRNTTVNPETTWRGYHRISLGTRKRIMLHRLVCETFIDNPKSYPVINHLNGIKTDNRAENLEWCTQSQNARHSLDVLHRIPGNTGKTGIKSKLSKPCIMLKDRKQVAEYAGASDAERATKINKSSIIQVCNGKRNSAGGYCWAWR